MSAEEPRPSVDDVGAVLVNWDSSDDLAGCVRALRQLYPDLCIVVVDNGSTTTESAKLEHLPPDVVVTYLPTNGGYAAGVNAGLDVVSALSKPWAWLVNPDARPDRDSLEQLLRSTAGAVALSPRQYSSPAPGTGAAYPSAAAIRRGRVSPMVCEGCDEGPHEVDVVTGTGLLIDVAAAEQAGLLDETFFHYKEEFDLVERMSTGGAVRLVCSASVWHRRGGSLAHESARASYYRTRNELLYLRKRMRFWFLAPRVGRHVVRSLALSCRRGVEREHRQAIRCALRDGVSGVGGPWEPR